jgi:hypothetical protein
MRLSKEEFRNLYKTKSSELIGILPSDEDIEENYKDYLELLDFERRDGVPVFEKRPNNTLTWYFTPLPS